MRLKNLKVMAVSSLVLSLAAISCAKSSGGGAPKPSEGSGGDAPKPSETKDPFIGTWNGASGKTLTISLEKSPLNAIPSEYNHKVSYNSLDSTEFGLEYCTLNAPATLTCYPYFKGNQPNVLVYNPNDSTVTFTNRIINTTAVYYQPGKVPVPETPPVDLSADFLHTFKDGTEKSSITISRGEPYEVKCSDDGWSAVTIGAVKLNFSSLSDQKKNVDGGTLFGDFKLNATYDTVQKTLTIHSISGACEISGKVFNLSK